MALLLSDRQDVRGRRELRDHDRRCELRTPLELLQATEEAALLGGDTANDEPHDEPELKTGMDVAVVSRSGEEERQNARIILIISRTRSCSVLLLAKSVAAVHVMQRLLRGDRDALHIEHLPRRQKQAQREEQFGQELSRVPVPDVRQ